MAPFVKFPVSGKISFGNYTQNTAVVDGYGAVIQSVGANNGRTDKNKHFIPLSRLTYGI